MKERRVRLQDLLGCSVRDSNSERMGRIEEIEAEQNADGCHATMFVLGEAGLLERLSVSTFYRLFGPARGEKRDAKAQRVPWEQMDLTDARRPKLRCTKAELEELQKTRVR